jgi:hypothetical protein
VPQHVLQRDLQTYLARVIPLQTDTITERHLRDCKPCVARLTEWADFSSTLKKLSAVLADESRERRRDPRFTTDSIGRLQVLNPFSAEYLEVNISDVSKAGLRLVVPSRVPRGSLLKVTINKSLFVGEARYCEPSSNSAFHVGVRLHDFYAMIPADA